MSDGSDGTEDQHSSVEELKIMIDELQEELKGNRRKELFRMAELMDSLNVRVEVCQIKLNNGKQEFALVIPITQFGNLRKAVLENLD